MGRSTNLLIIILVSTLLSACRSPDPSADSAAEASRGVGTTTPVPAVTGCSDPTAPISNISVDPLSPQETLTATESSPEPEPTAIDLTSEYPELPMTEEGPWLLYAKQIAEIDKDLFFMINEDGSGRKVFEFPNIVSETLVVSPSGEQIAYIAAGDLEFKYGHTLRITRLPSGEIEAEIPLYMQDWYETYGKGHEHEFDVMEAVGRMAWSPDGRYLAFVAAIYGPSSDLYVYDTLEKVSIRLTDGINQARIMSWSPDGQWIIHAEVVSFGTGAGGNYKSVLAAAVDGSVIRFMYDAGGRMPVFNTWLNPHEFISTECGIELGGCGNLSRAMVYSIPPVPFFEGLALSLAYDEVSKMVAFVTIVDGSPGVYLQSIYGGEPTLVLPGEWSLSRWESRNLFVARQSNQNVLGFNHLGEEVFRFEIKEGISSVLAAPNDRWLAVLGEGGLWLYDSHTELLTQQITGKVEGIFWGLDGSSLYVITGVDSEEVIIMLQPLSGDQKQLDSQVSSRSSDYHWIQPGN